MWSGGVWASLVKWERRGRSLVLSSHFQSPRELEGSRRIDRGRRVLLLLLLPLLQQPALLLDLVWSAAQKDQTEIVVDQSQ